MPSPKKSSHENLSPLNNDEIAARLDESANLRKDQMSA